jgi:hypothetical protein
MTKQLNTIGQVREHLEELKDDLKSRHSTPTKGESPELLNSLITLTSHLLGLLPPPPEPRKHSGQPDVCTYCGEPAELLTYWFDMDNAGEIWVCEDEACTDQLPENVCPF